MMHKLLSGGPNKTEQSIFLGLCSDQQLSFFTLLDRPSFPHYNNTKIIKFGWELFILWVISYGLWFLGFARFPEFRGTINDSCLKVDIHVYLTMLFTLWECVFDIGCVHMRTNHVPKDVSDRDPKRDWDRDLNYMRSHALQTPSQSRSGSAHCEVIFCSHCAVRADWPMHGFSAHSKMHTHESCSERAKCIHMS